jgi:hypothetical protein
VLKSWIVKRVQRLEISKFIETWHYSNSINGCITDYCYALYDEKGEMKGAMFYGRMAMANQWKRFSSSPDDVIELRRLCCVDDTPKNAESYFIGKSLKLLRKDWMKGGIVVSYSDKEFNHYGIIYKASNFKQLEDIPGARVIIYKGRRYHDKAIRSKYKGELKPYARRLKEALESGEAYYKNTLGKCTFVYTLKH